LAWTIIFGLSFATFLTLVFVPALYYLDYVIRLKFRRKSNLRRIKELNTQK
jgi:Cu/Ag efflux pump CusA